MTPSPLPAATTPSTLLTFFPLHEPYRTGFLRVSPLHELYFEESGNPQGQPVLFIHGGPGSGTEPNQRRFFDPRHYRIILFDQRGAGRSRPHASVEDNTTWDLVADIEKLRAHLHIDKWVVFGGSWGSTLALAYAETHPEQVCGLIVRGICLLTKNEIDWLFRKGASMLFPESWDDFKSFIPKDEQSDLLAAYHRRLHGPDRAVQQSAAVAFARWEACLSRLLPDPHVIARFAESSFAYALSRIESHYFVNDGFFAHDGQLLTDAHRLGKIPTVIIQGRYDLVCPMESAYLLHRAVPHADFFIVNDAGHSATEPGITHRLIEATERMKLAKKSA
ncbi:MAG TPA: prolyl aminopeptidase [Pseudomonadota bacterium]|nr:prolyl aminopeptidase [Pseudomonadota bacterium]HNN50735.1 prolyl aminopeptidase [Pseudomonadota bacterium]